MSKAGGKTAKAAATKAADKPAEKAAPSAPVSAPAAAAAPVPQQPAKGPGNAALREFTTLAARMELAWNKADAKSFASVFAEQADFIHFQGGLVHGRAAIETAHQGLFSGPYARSRAGFTISRVKVLNPNIAVLFLEQTLSFPVEGGSRNVRARATALVRRQEGGWKISVLQSTRIVAARPRAKAPS
jgi:uncharacterized protein (TIGR02246 family)